MTPLRRLLTYFVRHKKSLTLGGLCVVGSAIFSLLKPSIIGAAVNELAKAVTRGALTINCAAPWPHNPTGRRWMLR